jgi:tetratricopeptide (TPR) repeat protein
VDERVRLSNELYERAIFVGDEGGLAQADRELDAAEAELMLARGKVLHGQSMATRGEDPRELPLFERALELYRSVGDERGQSEAFFWIGCFHQVIRDDHEAATEALTLSRALATNTGDDLILSYALRHLGIAEHMAGHLDEARALLEESTRLRRELDFLPGVAANLIGLIYIASTQDRLDDARALADEATTLAESCGALKVLDQVSEARSRL